MEPDNTPERRAPALPGEPILRLLPCSLPPLSAPEQAGDAVIGTLRQAGYCAYRVGGCVRDRLLGRAITDVDVATDAVPATVQRLFPHTYAVGAAFGVVVVHTEAGGDVEVATFRAESGYADGRHPEQVRFSTPAEDAVRRDFTINALFYDPAAQQILDYTDGMTDLARGIVRAIGDPAARFAEDHLRLLRAVRFAAELGFALEPSTAAAIPPLTSRLCSISAERVYTELRRMLTGRCPARAFDLLHELGLLAVCLPEVAAMRGVSQPPQFHPEGDVWQHTLKMLGLMHDAGEVLAWAVLLHDVGKPGTLEVVDGRERFHGHARTGAELTRAILSRLHASGDVIEAVSTIVDNHMTFGDVARMRRNTLRRLIARPTFAAELELHRLDCTASHADMDNYVFLLDTLAEYAAEPAIPSPLLRGHDLLALGLKPGPRVGQLLREIQDRQLNGDLRTPQEALEWVKRQL
jgi:poly(A) polymerase